MITIEGFNVRFTQDHQEVDVRDALVETYLPAFAYVADVELRLLSALETLAEDLRDGGAEVDFTYRAA